MQHMNYNMQQTTPKAFIAKRVYCCAAALCAALWLLHALGDELAAQVRP